MNKKHQFYCLKKYIEENSKIYNLYVKKKNILLKKVSMLSMESYLYLISYLYPWRVTIDTKFYIFQYELVHDILYLN